MCGRFTLIVTLDELMLHYHIQTSRFPQYGPKYNVAPGQMVMTVIHDGVQNRMGELRWGLIPEWAKEEKVGFQMLNARAESLTEKPAFKKPFQRKRCLIPADSFYEWKGTGKNKQPMRILLKNQEVFSLAGLYDTWTSPDGHAISTFTIITTTPNDLVADIHDRMPVIIRKEDEAAWLDRNHTQTEQLSLLLKPYPAEEMYAYPVASRVGNVRHDDEQCIEEIRLLL
ncbi:putative SOS response-associated peptidase YedK [compost metagenome]